MSISKLIADTSDFGAGGYFGEAQKLKPDLRKAIQNECLARFAVIDSIHDPVHRIGEFIDGVYSVNPNFLPFPADPARVRVVELNFFNVAQKIVAIKEVRAVSGYGLKEAKDFVERNTAYGQFERLTLSPQADLSSFVSIMKQIGATVR